MHPLLLIMVLAVAVSIYLITFSVSATIFVLVLGFGVVVFFMVTISETISDDTWAGLTERIELFRLDRTEYRLVEVVTNEGPHRFEAAGTDVTRTQIQERVRFPVGWGMWHQNKQSSSTNDVGVNKSHYKMVQEVLDDRLDKLRIKYGQVNKRVVSTYRNQQEIADPTIDLKEGNI